MAYRGSSSDERLRAARAADRERDHLEHVLSDLANELAVQETRETEHEQLLTKKLSVDERELVLVARQQIESSCKELRAQVARIIARRDSLAAAASDLSDARAERVAAIAHTPNGRAALELVVHLGELDSEGHVIAQAISTYLGVVDRRGHAGGNTAQAGCRCRGRDHRCRG